MKITHTGEYQCDTRNCESNPKIARRSETDNITHSEILSKHNYEMVS
jgi:hypothetical protein